MMCKRRAEEWVAVEHLSGDCSNLVSKHTPVDRIQKEEESCQSHEKEDDPNAERLSFLRQFLAARQIFSQQFENEMVGCTGLGYHRILGSRQETDKIVSHLDER
jgi:hypothetical protein